MINWIEEANKHLKGKIIVEVRWLNKEEQEALDWYQSAPVLVLDDGTHLFCSQDDEGNGPGALFTTIHNFATLPTGV